MISRAEFIYTKNKFKELENALFEFEATNPIFLMYEKWSRMSPQDQMVLRKAWMKYYKDCRNSLDGRVYRIAKEAYKKKDYERVKKCAEIAEKRILENRLTIKKPSSVDPDLFHQELRQYFIVKEHYKELKSMYEEYKSTYESKAIDTL